jgi:hypothetical protein
VSWLALVLSTVLLAGCSPDNVGALGDIADATAVCVPLTRPHGAVRSHVVIGQDVIKNRSAHSVRVTGVALADSHGIRLTGSRLMPVPKGPFTFIGARTLRSNPEDYPADVREALDASRPAVGASIAAGEQVGLILSLVTDGGRMGPTEMSYTDSLDQSYIWTSGTRWRFPQTTCNKKRGR